MKNNRSETAFYPPFTSADIIAIRGGPALKKIICACVESGSKEEWIYYSRDGCTEEHYLFQDDLLAGYRMHNGGFFKRRVNVSFCQLG